MKALFPFVFTAGLLVSGFANSQQMVVSPNDLNQIISLANKVYSIPYRDAVCAFGNLRSDDREYIDKKFNDKTVREKYYSATFGDIFTKEIFLKYHNRCVNANSAGLKPDFRTADMDSEDDYLINDQPKISIKSNPVVIQANRGRIRLEILWRQVYTEGKNTQITNGRTDFILIQQDGMWRLSDAITNTTPDNTKYSAAEFEKTIGLIHLNDYDTTQR